MPKRKGKWDSIVTLAYQRVERGVRLSVGVNPVGVDDLWNVMALEAPEPKGRGGKRMEAVLNQHAHKQIGQFTLAEAIAKAQAFADAWKPGRVAECACDDIPAPPPRRGK